jgi:pimeloyl-ACP methyl ester carboxylesterase
MLDTTAVRYARVSDAITLAYEEFGDPSAPPLLLIAGLASQMLSWHEPLCESLAERGLRVIRFDNRDSGLSTHLEGEPDLEAMMGGDRSSAVYTLSDLAADAAALLDALGIESAHVVGVSMGGMIAQTLAAEHPDRVRSLTSISSTTGEREVSQPMPQAQEVLMMPRPETAEQAERNAVRWARAVGSPGLFDEDRVRAIARASFERAHDPTSFGRQLAAIWAAGNRTESVQSIRAPTLVIHGELDPLIPPQAGRATAAAIEGADLLTIDGMAHDMPPPLWTRLTDAIARHVQTAESS